MSRQIRRSFTTGEEEKPRVRRRAESRPLAETPPRLDPVEPPRRHPHVVDDWDPRGPWPEDVLDDLEEIEDLDSDDVLILDEDDIEEPEGGIAAP